ncbi:MAG: hypothetical protein FJ294_10025 [Planctomycetes bacterium]|nr:hypothetical protein [Planctomycetota bacterium]
MNVRYCLARVASALSLAAFASCASLGASVDNLEALHPSDGRHAYLGTIHGHFSWTMRNAGAVLLGRFGKAVQTVSAAPIEDPVQLCVDELNKLASLDGTHLPTGSTQVEWFARTAAYDPWCLSRETAIAELARAGARLALPERAPDLKLASVSEAEANAALAALVAAAKSAFEQQGDEHRAAFVHECQRMAALPLDFASGLRVLRGVNVLLRAASRRDSRVAPLQPLAVALQRRVLLQAIDLALMDGVPEFVVVGSDPGWPNERVQAAAVRAAVALGGRAKLGEILARNPFAGFGGERLVAALECVAQLGLPEAPPGEHGQAQRALWAETIYATAIEHPDGRVRLAAMGALGTMSGRGLVTLQEVEWQRWWQTEGAAAFRAPAGGEGSSGS